MRSFLTRLLLAALIPVLALVAAVVFFHARAREYYSRRPAPTHTFVADPALGYENAPNQRIAQPGEESYVVLTDERGNRVPAEPPPTAKPTFLFTGDSFTFGLWVNAEKTFAFRAGAALGANVVNVGVNGYGTVGALLRAEKFLDLHPKVVVYALIDDHRRRNVSPCAASMDVWCHPVPYVAPGPRIAPAGGNTLAAHEAEMDRSHPFGWRDLYWAGRRWWLDWRGGEARVRNEAALAGLPAGFRDEALRFLLNRWLRDARERDFRLVLVYLPDLADPRPAPAELAATLDAFAADPRFRWRDLSAPLQPFAANRALCTGDCHPSALAHEKIAIELVKALRAWGWAR